MKRRTRGFAAVMLLAGLLAWPVSAGALPLPDIQPDIPHINPVIVDMMLSVQEVNIPDDNLRDALCDLLDIPYSDPITRGDMAGEPLQGEVDLSGKGIKDLSGMQYAVNMQALKLRGNPVQKIPKEMKDLTNLVYLGLPECGLSEVPDNVWKMKKLQYLHLAGNELKELPSEIADLKELTELVLDQNQLEALPEQIGMLEKLEVLSASCNGIGDLPDSMKNCTELKELYLTGNRLGEIPDWIGSLVNLEVLAADGNEIRSLPGSMSSLDDMKTLSAAFNRIGQFPGCISGMDSLETLYLTANDIKELPAGLPDWSLMHIDLEWNDLDLTAPEIGSVLDGMEKRGIHAVSTPQKPVPVLTPDTGEEGVVKLQWPLIADTCSSVYTYTVAGLKLQRKTGDGDYAIIAEMDAGATGYEDGDIEPDNGYTYKITARYRTDTGYFNYTTYRVSTCDVEVIPAAAVAQTAQPTEAATAPPEETGEEVEAVQAPVNVNRGLLIGLGVLLILLLGVSVALVIVLARRRKEPLPLPAAERTVFLPPEIPVSGEGDENSDPGGTE